MKKTVKTLLCLLVLIILTNVSYSIAEERFVTYKPLRYVQGTVTDKSTGAKLSGVKVKANGMETTTDSNGKYKVQLTVNEVQLTFTKSGYQEFKCKVTGIQINETKTKDITLEKNKGEIKGVVSNAVDPTQKLSGVTVKCGDKTTTTNSQGEYSFTVQPGSYTLKFSKSGFIDASQNATVASGSTKTVNCSMSEILLSTECRVILTWGETPYDIDSHLFIKKGLAESHVWFSDKEPSNVDAKLDVDDTQSYGPETTTFTISTNGVYRFSVHDYTNSRGRTASQLSSSNSKVVVNYGNNTYEYYVPQGCGSNQYYWYVFKIENGVLIPVNTLGIREGDSF